MWVYFTVKNGKAYGFVANSYSLAGPRYGNYASFNAEAKQVHNFICAHRQTLPHVFDPETLGLMSIMETVAGN